MDGSMKLKMPSSCPNELSKLVEKCFSRNPEERPTFQGIYDSLSSMYK
jgi:hypothetical protein